MLFLFLFPPQGLVAGREAGLGVERLQSARLCGPVSQLCGGGYVAGLCVITWVKPKGPSGELWAVLPRRDSNACHVGLGSLTIGHKPHQRHSEQGGWKGSAEGPNSYLKELRSHRGSSKIETTT